MNIILPIKIITPKQPMRTDSLFYAGKNIARFNICNREYVLTTAGEYRFTIDGKHHTEKSPIARRLKNHSLKLWEQSGKLVVDNWGWFGINLWIDNKCQDIPTDCYSTYDEALKAFKNFIQENLKVIL